MNEQAGPSYVQKPKSLKHGLSENGLVEQPAIELFAALGWETANLYEEWTGPASSEGRGSKRDVILPNRLWPALRRLNPLLPEAALLKAAEELARDRSRMVPAEANREVHRLLLDGVKVKVPGEDGDPVEEVVRLIDWRELSNNDFLLGSQFWVASELYTRRCDLVGFVNGIPLVLIELKRPTENVKDAYEDNLRDYRSTIPQLFDPNAFVILSNGSKTRVGSTTAEWEHFGEWKRIDEEGEKGVVSLETAIRGTCEPGRLLDLVENFVAYQEVRGGLIKVLAQNHQYLGVNQAIAKVGRLGENQGRLGVFWHTQGSGKSLSMLFFCQKILRTVPGSWSFVVVTDRDELDRQIYKTFASTGAVTVGEEQCHAGSAKHLRELLQGNQRYVFTLIHKFRTDRGETHPVLSERRDVIVITDEAHRSQYDTLAMNMRTALPNAAFIGFTGTPLMAGEEKTREVFGDYVSRYNFAQSIEDGATVPLYYENRIPELQLTRDDLDERITEAVDDAGLDEDQEKRLQREFARVYQLVTREERLERIAEDIVQHFTGRGYRGKAMMIAIDKATAVRMHDKVKAHWSKRLADLKAQLASAPKADREALQAQIDEMAAMDMAVVVSQAQNEVADLGAKGLDIKPHRKRMMTEDLDAKFKDPKDPLRLVFVCAMWITGFDVPTCSTIYLDKPMRNHTLMQTIARANRKAEGKSAGLIVDYIGVFRDLQKALAIYAVPFGDGPSHPIADKQALVVELEGLIAEARAWLKAREVDLQAILVVEGFARNARIDEAVDAILKTPEGRKAYLDMANRMAKTYKAILPDPAANGLAPEAIILAYLAKSIRGRTEPPDVSAIIGEVEKLLDDAVAAHGFRIPEGSEPKALVNLSEVDFEALAEKFARSRTKHTEAEQLKAEVAQKVGQLVKANPTRVSFQERFEKLIATYNQGSQTIEVFFEELLRFARSLTEEEQRAMREELAEEELALFDLLTKPEPTLSKQEEAEVKKVCKALLTMLKAEKLVIDWRNKPQAKAEVKGFIRDVFDQLPEAYDRRIYGEKCDLVFQHVYERYQGSMIAAGR
jgi:type I restriction enzyme R subunit